MSLYSLRKSALGFSITKFDTDFNPEATYDLTVGLHNNYGCSCPAARRSVCRHRIMLPRMLGHVDDGWFYNYETQKWHRPLVEEAQLATEPLNLTATEVNERIADYKGPLPGDSLLEALADSTLANAEGALSSSDHYGISPAASILPDVRAWNALPQEERIATSARHVEERLGLESTTPAPVTGNIRRRA